MLNPQERKVAEMLAAGQEPSIDDLGQALMSAMQERDQHRELVFSMSKWLSQLAIAHSQKDTEAVATILDRFLQQHVRLTSQTIGVH
ncbi:MAG TPA: hypothetical protein VJ603_00740 [Paucimonas sp.]|nr:hypothetical protein [Paucimonas sp.]